MRIEQVTQAYRDALFDTDRGQALRVIEEAVHAGVDPEDVVSRVVLPTMENLGNRSAEDGATSLAQHFLASQISSDVVERMLPLFQKAHVSPGTVVIGISSLMVHTATGAQATTGVRALLKARTLEGRIKVAVGGLIKEVTP